MSRVILVRHGRTAWHVEGRYAGLTDIVLDKTGRAQAKRAAGLLSSEDVDRIYSSPLSRCLELAEFIAAEHDLEVVVDSRLAEIDLGGWDGETYEEILSRDGETFKKWIRDPTSVVIPGGESLGDVRDRAMDWFREATETYPEGTVVASSHGGTIRAIIASALGLDLSKVFRINIDLASVSQVNQRDGYSSMQYVNLTTHLAGLEERVQT